MSRSWRGLGGQAPRRIGGAGEKFVDGGSRWGGAGGYVLVPDTDHHVTGLDHACLLRGAALDERLYGHAHEPARVLLLHEENADPCEVGRLGASPSKRENREIPGGILALGTRSRTTRASSIRSPQTGAGKGSVRLFQPPSAHAPCREEILPAAENSCVDAGNRGERCICGAWHTPRTSLVFFGLVGHAWRPRGALVISRRRRHLLRALLLHVGHLLHARERHPPVHAIPHERHRWLALSAGRSSHPTPTTPRPLSR